MTKRRPGGFRAIEDSEPESPNANEAIAVRFFTENYLPAGCREDTEFRSTDELLYELRETVHVDADTVNGILTDLGYQIRFLEGRPLWVLYSKNRPDG